MRSARSEEKLMFAEHLPHTRATWNLMLHHLLSGWIVKTVEALMSSSDSVGEKDWQGKREKLQSDW